MVSKNKAAVVDNFKDLADEVSKDCTLIDESFMRFSPGCVVNCKITKGNGKINSYSSAYSQKRVKSNDESFWLILNYIYSKIDVGLSGIKEVEMRVLFKNREINILLSSKKRAGMLKRDLSSYLRIG